MTHDLSDDESDFEVDVVEISDSNSDVTRSPSPSKRSSSYQRRNKKVPKAKRRSTRLNTRSSSEDNQQDCVICHGFEDDQKFLQCLNCETIGHRSCLNLSSTTCPRLDSSFWQCKECKMCYICKAAESEVELEMCDSCDRGFHSSCVSQQESVQGSSMCPDCAPVNPNTMQLANTLETYTVKKKRGRPRRIQTPSEISQTDYESESSPGTFYTPNTDAKESSKVAVCSSSQKTLANRPEIQSAAAFVEEIMQIFIKTLTGRKTNFNFELDNTVRHVKEALQEKEGIQVEQIRLIYSGKQMSDECTLNDYNVKPGSTVHMVLQLRGGF